MAVRSSFTIDIYKEPYPNRRKEYLELPFFKYACTLTSRRFVKFSRYVEQFEKFPKRGRPHDKRPKNYPNGETFPTEL